MRSSPLIEDLSEKILLYLEGKEIDFNLNMINFDRCYAIQKRVILVEYEIPRGWVSTYKRIADHLKIKNGARVVGNALAKDPFPIIIPCHRVIGKNGKLVGYSAGIWRKKYLLELENKNKK